MDSKRGHPFPKVRVAHARTGPQACIAGGAMGSRTWCLSTSSQAHPWPQNLVGNTSETSGPSPKYVCWHAVPGCVLWIIAEGIHFLYSEFPVLARHRKFATYFQLLLQP
eukprot:jgi/Botrbrau1/7127/Bobra.0143s0007.1